MRHCQHPHRRRSRITEQINPAFLSSDDPFGNRAGTEEDYYWRALSGDVTRKDLLPATYLELHELCYEAWSVNPLASAILEITTSFVLGKGVIVGGRKSRASLEPTCRVSSCIIIGIPHIRQLKNKNLRRIRHPDVTQEKALLLLL
ncbi:hypothetical protein KDW_28530 [Dictyobacter vulcani]|uniref:Uncharacterized protein n=1 Tax=Dictyobacter vulcani TaxID=2607529 RepID=A0A5J4KQM1_9CHLR|nr:hypothetical protein [Dictyobacter vulcani]GER88691.1 hypothetical protein KDW_28530 [Dictyobacter vulcani]